jgi:basic amino acid/polyamine antiporter, APA family
MATSATPGSDVGARQEGVFVRRSSGLVRDVSPLKALFFSVAAVFGGGMAFTFQNMTLTGQPLWTFGLTSYAWSILAIATALALYGILMAILTSAMPRAGANYVFTSRILSPLLAWLESWCLLIAVIAVIAILLPLALLMLNYMGAAMEIAFPDSGFWDGAAGWFSDSGSQFIGGTIMVVMACLFAILPRQFFYRALTVLGFVAVITVVLVFIVTPFLSQDTFLSNVTQITGQTPEEIIAAGAYPEGGFSFLGFMAMCSFALFVFFGFQFASFIAGEMSGSVKRTALFAALGTLVLAGFISTIYNDVLARTFGLELTASWSYLFWTGGDAPGGIAGSPSTFGAIANPDLWPIWALLGLVAALFTWLLMPVYLAVASRIIIAWSLDRQAPEWIGRVNARTNAPIYAIVLCALAAEIILYLTTYQDLQLGATLWYTTLMFLPALILPGINAILARRRRPDLFGETSKRLPLMGVVWLVVISTVYVTAIFKPIYEGFSADTSFLNSSGVLASLITLGVGLILYYVNVAWNRSRGIQRDRVFAAIPPD